MKKTLIRFMSIVGSLTLMTQQASALVPYFGSEQYGTSLAARTALDTQATNWSSGLTGHSFSNLTVDGIVTLSNPHTIALADGSNVAISLRDFTGGVLGTLTASSPVVSSAATLQDGSPRPQSNPFTQYRNENVGSTSSRNAILFNFSEPFASFGGWFGDIETRQDGSGFNANYYLLDASQNIIYQGIVPSSTPLTSQTGCGGGTNGCGNKGSRWIGFDNDTNASIKYLLMVVGDDDGIVGSDGNTEHLSFYGGKVGKAYPDLWITKSATGTYKSGDNVIWTVTFGNSGALAANNVTVSDIGGTHNLIASGVIRSGSLAVGASQSITVTGNVIGVSGDSAQNSVLIATTDQEPYTGNNQATGSVMIVDPLADVAIAKTVNKHTAESGETINYLLTYRNNGPDTANNVTINDSFPTGFNVLSTSTGSLIGSMLTLIIDVLNAGAQGTISITGTIFGLSGDRIINTATITTTTQETTTGNNSGMDSTDIVVLCASNVGDTCISSGNSCGGTATGTIQCNGSCNAVTPSNPTTYGQICTGSANSCGGTATGTIQCNGSCNAVTPSNPVGYNSICYSIPNGCGMMGTGIIQCNGSCNAVTPSIWQCPTGGGGGGSYASCGNGVIDRLLGEECDDGNTNNGDECSLLCKKEIRIEGPTVIDNPISYSIKKLKQLSLLFDDVVYQEVDQTNEEHFVSPTLLPETGVGEGV